MVESTLDDGEYINTIFTADCISRHNKNADIVAAPSDIEVCLAVWLFAISVFDKFNLMLIVSNLAF